MAAHAKRPVWLDVDPGHDDAFALLLAGYSPSLRLIGVSTTHGNQSLAKTTANALSMLHAAGLSFVPVVAGAAKPLMRPAVHCPSIHGDTGLDSHEDGVTFPPLPADRKAVGSK
jgi:uridine nucleosidase